MPRVSRHTQESGQLEFLRALIVTGPVYGATGQIHCANLIVEKLEQLQWDEVLLGSYKSGDLKGNSSRVPVESFGDEYRDDEKRSKHFVIGILHGTQPGPTLLLNSHYDVEPVSSQNDWKQPWNSGHLEDGKIWGRGASDMLAGLSSQIYAATVFADTTDSWAGKIIFIAVPDEEIGGNGSLAAIRELTKRGLLDEPANTSCLISEPSNKVIGVSSLGFMHMGITVYGNARHMAGANREDNGLNIMIEIINNFNTTLKNIVEKIAPGADELMHNFGIIRGGIDAATPIDRLDSEATIFYPANISSSVLQTEIKKSLSQYGDKVSVNFSDFQFDGQQSPDNDLSRSLVATRPSKKISAGVFSSPCDARLFSEVGIQSIVVYGPGSLAQAHAIDEYVEIQDILEYNDHLCAALQMYMSVRP